MLLFAWIGLKVHNAVDGVAVLGSGVKDAGTSVQNGFGSAADAVGGVPFVAARSPALFRARGNKAAGM